MGGLRATFIADYIHTAFIYIAMCWFVLTVYGSKTEDSYRLLGTPRVVNNINFLLKECNYFVI